MHSANAHKARPASPVHLPRALVFGRVGLEFGKPVRHHAHVGGTGGGGERGDGGASWHEPRDRRHQRPPHGEQARARPCARTLRRARVRADPRLSSAGSHRGAPRLGRTAPRGLPPLRRERNLTATSPPSEDGAQPRTAAAARAAAASRERVYVPAAALAADQDLALALVLEPDPVQLGLVAAHLLHRCGALRVKLERHPAGSRRRCRALAGCRVGWARLRGGSALVSLPSPSLVPSARMTHGRRSKIVGHCGKMHTTFLQPGPGPSLRLFLTGLSSCGQEEPREGARWSAMRSTGRACRRIVGLLAVLVILSHGAVAAGPASCAVAVILRGGAQAGGKTSFQCVANTAISQLGPSSDLAQGATRSVCAGCAHMLCCAAVVRTPNSLPTRRVLTRRPVPPAAPATQPSKSTALALATTPCDRTHRQKRAQGARRTRCQPRHPGLRPSPPPPAALGARGWRVRTPCRGGRGAARSGGAGLG